VRLTLIEKGDDKGKWRVTVEGFDYYNTRTGGIESGGADQIAVWMLDTDYDGRSLFPRKEDTCAMKSSTIWECAESSRLSASSTRHSSSRMGEYSSSRVIGDTAWTDKP